MHSDSKDALEPGTPSFSHARKVAPTISPCSIVLYEHRSISVHPRAGYTAGSGLRLRRRIMLDVVQPSWDVVEAGKGIFTQNHCVPESLSTPAKKAELAESLSLLHPRDLGQPRPMQLSLYNRPLPYIPCCVTWPATRSCTVPCVL